MRPGESTRVQEGRDATGAAFVGILVGLAIQEGVPPSRDSMAQSGLNIVDMLLFSSFLLIAVTASILRPRADTLSGQPANPRPLRPGVRGGRASDGARL
jgi:hypothetical protein